MQESYQFLFEAFLMQLKSMVFVATHKFSWILFVHLETEKKITSCKSSYHISMNANSWKRGHIVFEWNMIRHVLFTHPTKKRATDIWCQLSHKTGWNKSYVQLWNLVICMVPLAPLTTSLHLEYNYEWMDEWLLKFI